MAKFNNSNSGEFHADSYSEVGMRQHKLTQIVVIKIFASNLYHLSQSLAAPF